VAENVTITSGASVYWSSTSPGSRQRRYYTGASGSSRTSGFFTGRFALLEALKNRRTIYVLSIVDEEDYWTNTMAVVIIYERNSPNFGILVQYRLRNSDKRPKWEGKFFCFQKNGPRRFRLDRLNRIKSLVRTGAGTVESYFTYVAREIEIYEKSNRPIAVVRHGGSSNRT